MAVYFAIAIACSLMLLGSAQEVAELRLVGGPSRCEGRLEILQNRPDSQFGQACDLDAGTTEVMVACRQLGCNPVGAERVDPVQYGFSTRVNTYVAFGFDCLGFEADLNVCLEPGAVCRADSVPHAVAIRCGEGEYVPSTGPTPTPRPIPTLPPSELRLVDGGVCEGRLEIAQGGSFLQSCGREVGSEEAIVVCRQLGCNPVGAERVSILQFVNSFNTSNSLRLFSRVCDGNESSIDACTRLGSSCILGSSTALGFRCGEGIPEPNLDGLVCQVQADNVVVSCVSNLDETQVPLSYICSYDSGNVEPCGPGPEIFIDVERFEPGTSHNLAISILTAGGQSEIDSVQFVVVPIVDMPIKISFDVPLGGREVVVGESGGVVAPLLRVTVDGPRLSDIPIRIVPMTYDEFQMSFSRSLLDQIFPARPINSAEEGDFEETVLLLENGGSLELQLPVDDSENEVIEGYLLVLEVDVNGLHPSDADRIQFLNRYILVTIEDDDSPLSCSSNIFDEVVTVNCVGPDGLPPSTLNGTVQCAVNQAPPFDCTFPYEISQSPLPSGSHMFTAFQGLPGAQDIVQTGGTQFFLPQLEVYFVNNTPSLNVDTVHAEFKTNRAGASLDIQCHLTHFDFFRINCSSGVFDKTGIPHGDYTLRVIARDPARPNEAAAIVRNRLWVHGDDIFCVTHLINQGLVVNGNSVTIDFRATGIVTSYLCSVDRTEYFVCSSPQVLDDVPIGRHRFKIVPQGCGRQYRGQTMQFTIN